MWLNDVIVSILSVAGARRTAVEMRNQRVGDTTDAVEEGRPVELRAASSRVSVGKGRASFAAARQKRD